MRAIPAPDLSPASPSRPAAAAAPCRVLLVAPRFHGNSFWNFRAACEVAGARYPTIPLGLITVAALLPAAWECRLINRNLDPLEDADLDWADMVMTGGMLPQRPDTLALIARAQARGKPVVVGGPDVTSSPEAYGAADFLVLGEAEAVMDDFAAAWDAGVRGGRFRAEPFSVDVTQTPIPRYDLLKRSDYMFFGVQFSRGCPFNCEFCDIIELYGRVPRTKTPAQVLAELDALYDAGYRGMLDFVDDNLIGNKKALRLLLPQLIAWQAAHGYPFMLSTEASINLADDDALLAMMRQANFFTVFIGIESPDAETLVHTQKKQNTRRSISDGVRKIHGAGMFVTAGFIVGFDTEKGSIAQPMMDCIEDAAIPICMVSLLYALPTTQLTRRLEREGRLLAEGELERRIADGDGDQCTAGLNFETARPRRDILTDHRTIVGQVYSPQAFFGRVRAVGRALRPFLPPASGPAATKPEPRIAGVGLADWKTFGRLTWRIGRRRPDLAIELVRTLSDCLRHNPAALRSVVILIALYLHMGPFAKTVVAAVDRQIARLPPSSPETADPVERPALARSA